MGLKVIASMLEQIAILHAAGTDGFAGSTAKTQVDMPNGGVAQWQPAMLNCAHQVNPSAWRVILVAGFKVSRA
jgi:hypothetical protein